MSTATENQTGITPTADRLVVRATPPDEVSKGGIVLPNAQQSGPTEGKVIAAGPGRMLQDGSRAKMEVGDGDTIYFDRFAGSQVEINGEPYVVIRETDVLFYL